MTLTEMLRKCVEKEMQTSPACPTCGKGRTEMGYRQIAELIGTNTATIFRFMKGKNPSAELIDTLFERYKPQLVNPLRGVQEKGKDLKFNINSL